MRCWRVSFPTMSRCTVFVIWGGLIEMDGLSRVHMFTPAPWIQGCGGEAPRCKHGGLRMATAGFVMPRVEGVLVLRN